MQEIEGLISKEEIQRGCADVPDENIRWNLLELQTV